MARQQMIEKIVQKPTWKEILIEMIHSKKLDPWDIDIVSLSDAFIERIKKMKELDLHVPANLILASAILLKYKSEVLELQREEVVEEFYEPPVELASAEISLVSRIPPKRPITLNELLSEMEKVIKYEKKKERPKPIIPELHIPEPAIDIEKRMVEVFEEIKRKKDSENLITFTSLLSEKNNEEIIYTLIPLLHLHQKEVIALRQDQIFGEIFIYLLSTNLPGSR